MCMKTLVSMILHMVSDIHTFHLSARAGVFGIDWHISANILSSHDSAPCGHKGDHMRHPMYHM